MTDYALDLFTMYAITCPFTDQATVLSRTRFRNRLDLRPRCLWSRWQRLLAAECTSDERPMCVFRARSRCSAEWSLAAVIESKPLRSYSTVKDATP